MSLQAYTVVLTPTAQKKLKGFNQYYKNYLSGSGKIQL